MSEEKFYFTFGYDRNFPYPDNYLIVLANNRENAISKFRRNYPDRHKNIINCADIYNEKQWIASMNQKYYPEIPAETIH